MLFSGLTCAKGISRSFSLSLHPELTWLDRDHRARQRTSADKQGQPEQAFYPSCLFSLPVSIRPLPSFIGTGRSGQPGLPRLGRERMMRSFVAKGTNLPAYQKARASESLLARQQVKRAGEPVSNQPFACDLFWFFALVRLNCFQQPNRRQLFVQPFFNRTAGRPDFFLPLVSIQLSLERVRRPLVALKPF